MITLPILIWPRLRPRSLAKAFIAFSIGGAFSIISFAGPSSPDSTEFSLARNYTFAACIKYRYPNSDLALEADAWAASLVELGGLPASHYSTLANWVKSAPQPLVSRTGLALNLQNCMNFVNARTFRTRLQKVLNSK